VTVVAIASLKGGVGKTTSAIHLAECAYQLGQSPAIIDADSEQSALRWAAYGQLPYRTIVMESQLETQIADLLQVHSHIIIDSPPNQRALIGTIAKVADHVIVPALPTGLDLDRLLPTLDVLRVVDANRPGGLDAAVFLNRWTRRERLAKEAIAALEHRGLPLLRARVRDLARYRQAFGGRPAYTVEYMAVWKEVLNG
jgi:chromosome partitioning protein